MREYYAIPLIAQGSNDIFVPIGFCPDVIRITEWASGLEIVWCRWQGIDTAITIVAAGDKTVQTGEGVVLGSISEKDGVAMSADTDFTAFSDSNWAEGDLTANAVKLTSDLTGLTDHALLLFEAFRMSEPVIRAVHDGGDTVHTYFQDSSIDFRELGVSGGAAECSWLLYNLSNNNYCFISDVVRPSGQAKYCRLMTAEAKDGTATAAADFDDDDVALILPRRIAQYPLSDYGLMT
jgi:hypothetical protein